MNFFIDQLVICRHLIKKGKISEDIRSNQYTFYSSNRLLGCAFLNAQGRAYTGTRLPQISWTLRSSPKGAVQGDQFIEVLWDEPVQRPVGAPGGARSPDS